MILTGTILTGCARQTPVVIKIKIPPALTQNIQYNRLYGHYGRPLPVEIDALRQECIDRGKDVIVLVTAIKNKNHELEAIRKQQE